MFDVKKYYEKENKKVRSSYEETLLTVKEIVDETRNYSKPGKKKQYYQFFNTVGKFILKLTDYERALNDNYFSTRSFTELLKENNALFTEIIPRNYNRKSYANPTYCVKIFGNGFGQLLSYFYVRYRQYITYAFSHKIFKMEENNRLFIGVFNYIKDKKIDYESLRGLITKLNRKDKTEAIIIQLKEQFDKTFRFFTDTVCESELGDLRYLFRYGRYISESEIKTAKFLLKYPEGKIKKLSRQIAQAYVNGFIRNQRDISKKSTLAIMFPIGQERIVRPLIRQMKRLNLETSIMNVSTTKTNKQYIYDHRFDNALYLDRKYANLYKKGFEEAGEKCKKMLKVCSGLIVLDTFGEPTFTPEIKKGYIKLTDEQQKLYQSMQNEIVGIHDRYFPRKETSFTVIAFPTPKIGRNFEAIFEDILEVNMLDTKKYERVQQKIIDVLDTADYVHIKGKGKSKTDMMVKMQELKNPNKETNFLNCGADVNIPLGEVFTSPRLKGTNGILHIPQTYLHGLKFVDLNLVFKDGYIVKYSCKNFDKLKDNKKYIEENLLFPHKTLPIGEFAIGTNTLAYVVAKKHRIMHLLPVLIIEKMGPHFAIGDTCFSREEDKPVYNSLDNKEITARENEKTALRKTKPNEAYTYRHIDITIPYESIGFISVIPKKGRAIDIIRDGRFVLKGTEVLNKPFSVSKK